MSDDNTNVIIAAIDRLEGVIKERRESEEASHALMKALIDALNVNSQELLEFCETLQKQAQRD